MVDNSVPMARRLQQSTSLFEIAYFSFPSNARSIHQCLPDLVRYFPCSCIETPLGFKLRWSRRAAFPPAIYHTQFRLLMVLGISEVRCWRLMGPYGLVLFLVNTFRVLTPAVLRDR